MRKQSRLRSDTQRLSWTIMLPLLCLTQSIWAADVDVQLSSYETYVSVPITMQIVIRNPDSYEAPVIPTVPGVKIIGGNQPSTSSQISIINGKTSRVMTITYRYQLIPQRVGAFEIPPIEILVDEETYRTAPQTIVVSESETTDLMYVEMTSERDRYFVGEQFDVTLQIWLRPYRDRQHQLKERQMWRTINTKASSWGAFQDTIEQEGGVTVRTLFRNDSQGQRRAYYVYELSKTLWAESAGRFDASGVTIVAEYPTQVGRVRDPFWDGFLSSRNRVGVVESRPLSATLNDTEIDIRPLPEHNRPADFTGAVGQFTVTTSAKPTTVTVGDPITLTMSITGSGQLDILQPPPLKNLPIVTERFKVPSDPMSGHVLGNNKTFTDSIRPLSDDVQEVPAIPFSYFDPLQEKYMTVYSDPIPVMVSPAQTLSAAELVPGAAASTSSELVESQIGLLANYHDADELLAHQAFNPGWRSAIAWALPPLIYTLSLLVNRQRLAASNTAHRRRKQALRVAMQRLSDCRSHGSYNDVSAALVSYVADRFDLPSGLTRQDIVSHLADHNIESTLIEEISELLGTCENHMYGGASSAVEVRLIEQIERCICTLERTR